MLKQRFATQFILHIIMDSMIQRQLWVDETQVYQFQGYTYGVDAFISTISDERNKTCSARSLNNNLYFRPEHLWTIFSSGSNATALALWINIQKQFRLGR